METRTEHVQGSFDSGDSRALRRIYDTARHWVEERITINDEIERRLAVIVLYTYGAEALAHPVPAAGEGAIVRTCIDRLLARTAMA